MGGTLGSRSHQIVALELPTTNPFYHLQVDSQSIAAKLPRLWFNSALSLQFFPSPLDNLYSKIDGEHGKNGLRDE